MRVTWFLTALILLFAGLSSFGALYSSYGNAFTVVVAYSPTYILSNYPANSGTVLAVGQQASVYVDLDTSFSSGQTAYFSFSGGVIPNIPLTCTSLGLIAPDGNYETQCSNTWTPTVAEAGVNIPFIIFWTDSQSQSGQGSGTVTVQSVSACPCTSYINGISVTPTSSISIGTKSLAFTGTVTTPSSVSSIYIVVKNSAGSIVGSTNALLSGSSWSWNFNLPSYGTYTITANVIPVGGAPNVQIMSLVIPYSSHFHIPDALQIAEGAGIVSSILGGILLPVSLLLPAGGRKR